MSGSGKTTVGEYLIDSLAKTGLKHVFGIQGDGKGWVETPRSRIAPFSANRLAEPCLDLSF